MIVVASNPRRRLFSDHFLAYIHESFQRNVCVVETEDQELGAIKWASERFSWFCLFQDSMWLQKPLEFVKKATFLNAAYILPRPSCYSMIYSSQILETMEIPMPGQDKELAIHYETAFCDEYERKAVSMGYGVDGKLPVLYPEATDAKALESGRITNRFGDHRIHLKSSCSTVHKAKATYR